MNMPQEIQELENKELLEEYEGGIRHLTICDIEGQIDSKEENISHIARSEILNRMSD